MTKQDGFEVRHSSFGFDSSFWFRHSGLILLSLVLVVARLRSYREPPEWDVGTYTAIAREMLAGERLYADAWDIKPPAIFVTYAAVQFFTGDGFLHIYLLSVIASIVTMLGVYSAASVAGRAAGMWAAAFWAAMCYEPGTGGNLPNTEVFINAAVAWGFGLWVNSSSRMTWRRAAAIGLLFALASLYKQVAVAPMLGMMVGHCRWWRRWTMLIGVVLATWAVVLAYFAATDRGWLAWQTFFVAPRGYSGSVGSVLLSSLTPQKMVSKYLLFAIPAMALAIVAAMPIHAVVSMRVWRLFLGLCLGTHLAVALPGQFHWHYYQLWFVPLAIGAGWGAAAVMKVLEPRRPALAYAIVVLALAAMTAPQASWYRLSSREWAKRKYGDFFVYSHDAFREAARRLPSNETFYTWSDEAYAYSITGRRPPATALWKMHTTTGPLAEWLTRRTLEDLEKNKPAMIILYGESPGPEDHPILEWTKQHYDLVPDERRKFFPLRVYVRRDGTVRWNE